MLLNIVLLQSKSQIKNYNSAILKPDSKTLTLLFALEVSAARDLVRHFKDTSWLFNVPTHGL